MGDLTLFLGGAKSGKTTFALAAAQAYPPPRYYLATAQGLDDEMKIRIKNHQAERGPEWRTIEAPLDPAASISELSGKSPVLLDCLTLWLNNLLGTPNYAMDISVIMTEVEKLAIAVDNYAGPVIMVSNEVGCGIVPDNTLARFYRDALGAMHQFLAARAKTVWLVVAGLKLQMK